MIHLTAFKNSHIQMPALNSTMVWSFGEKYIEAIYEKKWSPFPHVSSTQKPVEKSGSHRLSILMCQNNLLSILGHKTNCQFLDIINLPNLQAKVG